MGVGGGAPSPTLLLLGGENGTKDAFLAVVRDALSPRSPELMTSIDMTTVADPTFAAARGMAIYARRRQEVPGHCMEHQEGEAKREKQRAGEDRGRDEL